MGIQDNRVWLVLVVTKRRMLATPAGRHKAPDPWFSGLP